MEIRRLNVADRMAFAELSALVVEALDNKEFLIPMTEAEADVTFAEDSTDIVLGGFVDGRLVATVSLLHDINDYSEFMPVECQGKNGAEIGEAMVLPEYRRTGLMNELCKELTKCIMSSKLDFILATAHPDNAASNHLLTTGGFKLHCVFSRRGYTRNFYVQALR